MTGLFFELGPASINEQLEPVRNPHSWNSNATVIFLDQPVNVGYSYSSQRVNSTHAAAPDVYAFLELFFSQFERFAGNDFHIAGESYCGHYIPEFATEVLSHSDRSFNLTSVLIGNGITDPLIQNEAWEWMACGKGGYPPVISEDECQHLRDIYPTCRNLTQTCYNELTDIACVPANVYCDQLIEPYRDTGRNFFDIRDQCGDSSNCYVQENWIADFMNLDKVKHALGTEVKNFTGCDSSVSHDFGQTGDRSKPYQGHVARLLEEGLPVLIYAGDKDFRCNWLGNQAWVEALEWSGRDEFLNAANRPWKVNDIQAGTVRNAGPFTFLRIFDAGHMVPYNQPLNALGMLNEWLLGNIELA
jgi:cathepsin A (carboxypeptidase C)